MKIRFLHGTILPATISVSDVTETSAQTISSISVDQESNTVTIVGGSSTQDFSGDFTFSANAGIRNPSVPSTRVYKMKGWTTGQALGSSSPYRIKKKTTSTVGDVAITPTPRVKNAKKVSHRISFRTGSRGRLKGGTYAGSSRITIDFGSSTVVPTSITGSDISVAGIPVTEVTVQTSGAGGVVQVTIPDGVVIGDSTSVTLDFSSSSGFEHNSTIGSNTAVITTTADSNASGGSGSYTIEDIQDMAVTLVTPSPSAVNGASSYSIKFATGSSGALSVGSTITIIFPTDTEVPATINEADILVNSTRPTIAPTTVPASRTLTITSPVSVANLGLVTVLIGSGTGTINPSSAGAYTLDVKTSEETTNRTSPSYTLTAPTSTVTAAGISINPAIQSTSDVDYTITFSTGANGRLQPSISKITITLPSGTTVTDGTLSAATINGVSASATGTAASRTIELIVPAGLSIGNSSSVTVFIPNGIKTPTAGIYTLQVKTSVETGDIISNSFTVSTVSSSVSIGTITVVDDTTARTAQYTVPVTPGVTIPSGGTITLEFPSGTTVPSGTITASAVTINGSAATAVSGNSSLRRLVITNPSSWSASTQYNVVVTTSANILNPSEPASYTLNAWSSEEPTAGTSPNYTLYKTQTSITSLTVTSNPVLVSTVLAWSWNFTTSSTGALTAGYGAITLRYPESSLMPESISTGKINVNGVAAYAVTTGSGVGDSDSIIVTVANNIGNNTAISLVVELSANVTGTELETPVTYGAYTSSDPTQQTKDFALPVELSTFNAEVTSSGNSLTWTTESEIDNLGFHVYRSVNMNGPYVKITERLIPGLVTSSFGQDYYYMDMTGSHRDTVYYMLQDVATYGALTMHGPVFVDMRGSRPKTFELIAASPNPFNPSTKISYSVSQAARVRLVVYNLAGQVVKVIENEELYPAIYSVIWDGKDQASRPVGSGNYFVQMVTKSLEDGRTLYTTKMGLVLLR